MPHETTLQSVILNQDTIGFESDHIPGGCAWDTDVSPGTPDVPL